MTDRDHYRIFVGYSAAENEATKIAIESITRHTLPSAVSISRLSRLSLHAVYTRLTRTQPDGTLWDVISNAPMSTDHALARFFVPHLCDYRGWAVFTDGDILCRQDIRDLFAQADDQYAVMCVQHPPLRDTGLKKDNTALQVAYPRKNWSSVMLLNCGHPANEMLSLQVLNNWTGRELHAFQWLHDDQIGALPPEWNYLVGVSPPMPDPAIVHYTLGLPSLVAYTPLPFADEWYQVAAQAHYPVPTAQAIG